MPYYLHRADVTEEQLQTAIDNLPAPFESEYEACHCDECRKRAQGERDAYMAKLAASSIILGRFDAPGDAHQAKGTIGSPEVLSVSFIATRRERESWRYRERYRPNVDRLPWTDEPWQVTLNELHYAYVSALKPGLIAYTASEEHGVADRQTRVRPGRYLEQFAPFLSQRERDEYCARIKALDDRNVVKFAKTAEEIEAVYRQGPGACMSHPLSSYVTSVHPTSVYGDSDLQVAYLGDIDTGHGITSGRKVRARCVVWPAEKRMSRLYGDDTLGVLLEGLGYGKGPDDSEGYGNLEGARIHRINHYGDYYVMPYIDATAWVAASADGKWFVLGAPDDSRSSRARSYSCRQTNGTTSDEAGRDEDSEESVSCANCGDGIDRDDTYCSTCYDDRRECVVCGHEFFDDSPALLASSDNDPVCARCVRTGCDGVRSCNACSDLFREGDYSATATEERETFDVCDHCESCGDEVIEERKAEAEAEAEAERKAEAEEGRAASEAPGDILGSDGSPF